MAKVSAIEKNKRRRKRWSKKYAAKRAAAQGDANDKSLPMEERFAAR
jgi:small subunit ribosomal protein S14